MTRCTAQKTVLASLLACCACARSEAGDPPEPPRREVAPAAWKRIPSLGIEVRVPRDAEVLDNAPWTDVPSSTIYFRDGTPTTVIVGATTGSDAIPKDLDAARAKIQRETAGFQAFTRQERTADGFTLVYRGAAVTDPNEPLFGLLIRSRIGDLTLDCKTTASSKTEIARTVTVCRSIRAAK